MAGGYERTDVNIRTISKFVVALVVLIAVSMAAMAWMFFELGKRPEPADITAPLAQERVLPPVPRLQLSGQADLNSFRAREENILSSYGWIDRKQGVVRIPVDRAIELLAERGLPARKPVEAAKP